MFGQIGSPGLAYNLYGTNQKVYATGGYFENIYGQIDQIKDTYSSYIYYLLMKRGQDACSVLLTGYYQQLITALSALNDYFTYYNFGNPKQLRQAFMNQCANNLCGASTSGILDSLTGDFEQGGCDLLTFLNEGYPDQGFYQGHRDYVTNMAAFVFDLAVIGITTQAAYAGFNSGSIEQWRIEQNRYILNLKSAYDRIMEYDRLNLDDNSVNWNAQRNLRPFLQETLTDNMTLSQVSSTVQQFFTTIYPSKFWLVYAYQNVQGQSLHSWQCQYCFAALNVKNSYHILIAGINRNAVPNTQLIYDPYFNNINDYKNQANKLTTDWFNNQCLMGVFATSGDIVGSFSGVPDFKGIRIIQSSSVKTKTTAAIWAIQGACPHNTFQA